MEYLFIDIETFSAVSLTDCGLYKYIKDPSFKIQLCGYAVNSGDVTVLNWWEDSPEKDYFLEKFKDKSVVKVAHNAAFERNSFAAVGLKTSPTEWMDTMTMANYCSLPGHLADVCEVLAVKDAKLGTGKALIKFFAVPQKPRVPGEEYSVNEPWDYPEKWEEYRTYNKYDVLSEREIFEKLYKYRPTDDVWTEYSADADINDRGVLCDTGLVEGAIKVCDAYSADLVSEAKAITGLQNPNSVAQLSPWIKSAMAGTALKGYDESRCGVTKEAVEYMFGIPGVEGSDLGRVLEIRKAIGKSSVKKYWTMRDFTCVDGRIRGLFRFYGAAHTGRWSGRDVQLQNLTKNHCSGFDLDCMREAVRSGRESLVGLYGEPSDVLSQLVRTALVVPEGKLLYVADYSAIEARVLAWLAGEDWILDAFRANKDIYCVQASKMYGVPVEKNGVNKHLRAKGKIAVLALGYQGAWGALENMGAEDAGITKSDGDIIVQKYRDSAPMIVKFWRDVEYMAKAAVRGKTLRTLRTKYATLSFDYTDDFALRVKLPSGRELFYVGPYVGVNRFGNESLMYKGSGANSKWVTLETYGGKLVENITQAVARDLLAGSLVRVNASGVFEPVLHVHDEIGAEGPSDDPERRLKELSDMMSVNPDWSAGLPLRAEGFYSRYYMKD